MSPRWSSQPWSHEPGHDLDGHDHDVGASRRTTGPDESTLLRAAASGRADVAGPRGMLALQRAAGNGAAAALAEDEAPPVQDVVTSSGSSIDDGTRQEMETRMGHDFGHVRVHTGDEAHQSARSMGAHAYTVGSDIVFQRGAYDPGSHEGKTLLAHELTHVVQQSRGPVDGTPTASGVSLSDPSDRFEREASANAVEVMSRPAGASAADAGSAPAAVQRDAVEGEEEQEEAQAARDESLPDAHASVQREGDEELEDEGATA